MTDIAAIEDISALNFKEHYDLLQNLEQQAEEKPETAASLLPDFYRLLEGKGSCPDMLPTAAQTFAVITQNLSASQIKKAVEQLYALDKGIVTERGAHIICRTNPASAIVIFNHFFDQVKQKPFSADEKNSFLVNNMQSAVLYAADSESRIMLAKIDSLPEEVQELFYPKLGDLYAQKPALRPALWQKITRQKCENASQFSVLYKNLNRVVSADPSKAADCLSVINESISNPKQDTSSLKAAYAVLGQIRQTDVQKEKTDAVLMRGLQHPANNLFTRRAAYRQMGKIEELTSRSTIGERVDKTADNPFGFKSVDNMVIDQPAVLFLGGDGTNSEKAANGYLSSIEKLMQKHNLQDPVALYAAVYAFGEREDRDVAFNEYSARTKLMQDHYRSVKIKKELNEDTLHPHYVDDIFKKVFLPRLCGKNGRRLPAEEVCRKMRRLTVVAHCHGAYTFLKLEEKMQEKMKELGYTPEERAKIQHEVLCVAHAPYAPLGVSKSTMISFASAQDYEVRHYNNFEHEIRAMNKNKEVKLGYFPAEKGELFLTPSMGEDIEQHNFLGYDTNQCGLSTEGQIILALAGHAIVNGIRNSSEGKPLPPVKDLVCGQDERICKVFKHIKESGAQMWQKMAQNSAVRLKEKYANER